MTCDDPLCRLRRILSEPVPEAGDSDFIPVPVNEGPAALTDASVLIPLVPRPAGITVVLTKRAEALKHHAGQISFPGGRLEATDSSAEAGALREAEEEIGIAPASVEILGQCAVYETSTGFRIKPFVGVLHGDARFVPQQEEVDDIFEVPFGFLMDAKNFLVEVIRWNGTPRRYRSITHGRQRIWGATAGILYGLATRYAGR